MNWLNVLLGAAIFFAYMLRAWPARISRWMPLAIVVLLYSFVFGSFVLDVRLAWSGASSTGTVLSAYCGAGKSANAVTISYRFDAGGFPMEGAGLSGQGNRNCGIQVGDPVYVSYLPKEPNVNVAVRNPGLMLFYKLLAALAFYAFLVWYKTPQGERWRERIDEAQWYRK